MAVASDNAGDAGFLNVVQFVGFSLLRLSLLSIALIAFTVMLVSPATIRSTISADRRLAHWEGMPLSVLPLWHQASHMPLPAPPATQAATAPAKPAEMSVGTLINDSTVGVTQLSPTSEDPFDGALMYFASLVWPRMIVFACFLPALLGLIWAAWSFGRAAHSRLIQDGGVERPERYKRALNLFETISNLTIAWIFIPYPLPSVLILLPGLGSLYFIYRLAENRA